MSRSRDLTPRPPLRSGEGVFKWVTFLVHWNRERSDRVEPRTRSLRSRFQVEHPLSASERGPGGEVFRLALFLLLLALVPLVGHGCHGDDVDHEPSVPPPVYNHP